MSNDQPKLTLARWAELDQAASPGPWVLQYPQPCELYVDAADGFMVVDTRMDDACSDHYSRNFADAELIAASRQAPTRLLAALRGLIEKWDGHADGLVVDEADWVQQCAQDLRHLIEQTDLADPEQPR